MSDDLVATLHQAGHDYTDKAADLIKAQAARIAELEEDLEEARRERDQYLGEIIHLENGESV